MKSSEPMWHVLQLSDALDVEFASALAEFVPVTLWEPDRSALPLWLHYRERERTLPGSPLRIRSFPVMRGYARFPFSWIAPVGPAVVRRMARHSHPPELSVLVCTTPFFASAAERWPGPVVYWLTDLVAEYEGVDPAAIRRLDKRMCRAATLVCPNSERLAFYLCEQADCPPEKLLVLPNATRVSNILPAPLEAPTSQGLEDMQLTGPLAGVIGNLADNTDWVFLERLLDLTPWLSWIFVGPADKPVREPEQRRARAAVMRHARTHFTGTRPLCELFRYARAFSVAVLPYRRREPTFSGSSTRFYEHLAACHPIVATPGVAELRGKPPLLRLVETPEQAACALEELRVQNFNDGLREVRWEASRTNTWRDRALAMRAGLEARFSGNTERAWRP